METGQKGFADMTTFELSREQIIAGNPLERVISRYGIELKRHSASQVKGLCPFHKENSPSFYVDTTKQLFKCFGCNVGGSVIDFVSKHENISVGEAMKKLSPQSTRIEPVKTSPSPILARNSTPLELVATYDYQDETGKVVYRALRYNPKTFKQCQIKDGKEIWNMEGVRRVLYRLPLRRSIFAK